MDRFQNVILAAGLGCFVFAFVLSGLYPYMITDARADEATIEEVARDVSPHFKGLKDAYPVAFARAFPRAGDTRTAREQLGVAADDPRRADWEDAWREAYAFALREGRDIYVAEACWHCHSQFVRPVANESVRFGPVSTAAQDNNALQRPVLWGTRRVGPDLTYEGGKRSNDWHVAHLNDPRSTSPGSVMPSYPWYLRDGWQVKRRIDPRKADLSGLSPDTAYGYPGIYDTEEEARAAIEEIRQGLDPNLAGEGERLFVERSRGPSEKGLALIAYLQWLGTWQPQSEEGGEE